MAGPRLTRRFVVGAFLAAGGGLVLGFALGPTGSQPLPRRPDSARQRARDRQNRHPINAWIVVTRDNRVIVRIARAELGQGTLTGLAQLAAEGLDCDWAKVSTELVAPEEAAGNGALWGEFVTGSSRSIRFGHLAMFRAGHTVRLMLLQAAASAWNVSASELATSSGVIRHEASKRTTTYGQMAEAAAMLAPPDARKIELTDRASWRIAGKPLASLDAKLKVTGAAIYGIDVIVPGMLSAAIRAAPVPGGRLKSFDDKEATALPGVKMVLPVGGEAVAVVADTWWRARSALDVVAIEWAPVEEVGISNESISAFLATGLTTEEAFIGRAHGDALASLRASTATVEAVYATPFLYHATLEPMNATAVWQPDSVEVWAPTQNAEATLRAAAEAAGLPVEQARINRTMVGGSFGRRLKQDCVRQAVLIAKAMPGVPIKLIWDREEDMARGFYRPVTQARLRGGVDEKGQATGLIVRISGQSILASNLGRGGPNAAGRDPRMFQGLYAQPGEAQLGYSIPSVYIDHAMRITHVPVGSWRGVHTTQNGVYLECFIDEMAQAARRDPLDFRRGLLRGHPKHLAVLDAAAERAGWSTPPAAGVHRGVAQLMAVGSYAAVVVELRVDAEGMPRIERVVAALDCGVVVNPRLVEAQIEGAVVMGLSAALHEEISIDAGQVVERNFDTYPVLRLAECPRIETVLVPSGESWGGVGDAVIGAVAPALLNALFRATGKRIRKLPLRKAKLR